MKKFSYILMYAFMLSTFLSIVSCQDPVEEVVLAQETDFQVSVALSAIAKEIATFDGSSDNIVDGSSCISVLFPYKVVVNDTVITVSSAADFAVVEEVLDILEANQELVELVFPISVIKSDYSEQVLNSKEEFNTIIKDCKELGEDIDLECIDFLYPLELATFNVGNVQTGSLEVNTDKELRLFVDQQKQDDLFGFQFPVSLITASGIQIQLETPSALLHTLEAARDICDEDDDNDYNDDDFNLEPIEPVLTNCSWKVIVFNRFGENYTQQYLHYVLTFKADNIVLVKDSNGNIYSGIWSNRASRDGALVSLSISELEDFNIEWRVYKLASNRIKFFELGGNRIVTTRYCPPALPTVTELKGILLECPWILKKVENNNTDINNLLGASLQFLNDQRFTLTEDIDSVETGEWDVYKNSLDQTVLGLSISEVNLSFEWVLSISKDDRLQFQLENNTYQLNLERNCNNDDSDTEVVQSRSELAETIWTIGAFKEIDVLTDSFSGKLFHFKTNGELTVLENNNIKIDAGRWYLYRNADASLELIITFKKESVFYSLSNDYLVKDLSVESLSLSHENDIEGGFDTLNFDRFGL